MSGEFDRFPDLPIIIGHRGKVILFALERIDLLLKTATKLERPVAGCIRQNLKAFRRRNNEYSIRSPAVSARTPR